MSYHCDIFVFIPVESQYASRQCDGDPMQIHIASYSLKHSMILVHYMSPLEQPNPIYVVMIHACSEEITE